MLVISNHAIKSLKGLNPKPIVRVNMAWVKSLKELYSILNGLKKYKVFLDYPDGRTKPPKPTLSFTDAYKAISQYNNIKYFAISNSEDCKKLNTISMVIGAGLTVVPKIESKKGVENIKEIADSCESNIIMLDKEDIYVSVKANQKEYDRLIHLARKMCKKYKIRLLELEGVIFKERHE